VAGEAPLRAVRLIEDERVFPAAPPLMEEMKSLPSPQFVGIGLLP